MDLLVNIFNAIKGNVGGITEAIAYIVLAGSVIVKLTPTLADDNYFKTVIKFIGKYIALDKYGPKGEYSWE